ncbi:uncharacterized protein LOC120896812 [Anopheles arabiensis]|uniref:uncharacterized protein LOC120896812 n=1 Tax=Anopheles arabiensis TaxID=7173 RepID=UPI001AACB952|nr:uncharacterized protein LOC120896812 [Anopheles arabiensis]
MHHLLYLYALTNVATGFTLLSPLLSLIVQRECNTPGIVDLRVLFDSSLEVDNILKPATNHSNHCTGPIILQQLFSNVSFGHHLRKTRLNVVHISNLTENNLQQIGTYIKQSANYDWGAKYLFHLPSLTADQLSNFTAVATILSGQRLYNNLFAINRKHLLTFNVLNSAIHRHDQIRTAVQDLFQDKFRQMHRYHLEDLIDVEIYPFHFVIYGKFKIFNREAYFITMAADRLNLSMVEREDQLNLVFKHQFKDHVKENGIIVTYGHSEGDFRRIWTNDMEGLCIVVPAANILTIFNDLIDPFDRHIWLLWFVCSELTAIVWTVVKCVQSPTARTPIAFLQQYGELHLVLLQCCVLAPPELKRIRKIEQLLLFCYILAVFHIVTVYVSVVISNLSTVRYANTLDTLQDLIVHQTPIIGTETQLQILRQRAYNLNFEPHGEYVATVMACSHAQLAVKHSPNVYKLIQEPLISHYIVYLLHKESILQEVLERYVALSYQANLYRYWDNFILQKVPIARDRTAFMADVIKFDDIIWFFVLLPVGAALGMVVFLLEIACYRLTERRSKGMYK